MKFLERRASSGLAAAGADQHPHQHAAANASVRLRRSRSLLPLNSAAAANANAPSGHSFTCPTSSHSAAAAAAGASKHGNKESFRSWIVKPQKWSLLCLLFLILSMATTCSFVMHYVLFALRADSANGSGTVVGPWMDRGPHSPLSFLRYGASSHTNTDPDVAHLTFRKRNYSWVVPPRDSSSKTTATTVRREKSDGSAAAPRFAPRVTYLAAMSSSSPVHVMWSLENQFYRPDRNLSTSDVNHMDNNNDLMLPSEETVIDASDNNATDAAAAPGDAIPAQPTQSDFTTDRTDGCLPMAEWQTQSFPNCNMFHEMDVRRSIRDGAMAVLGRGWFRTTWMYNGTSPYKSTRNDVAGTTHVPLVLKTLRIEREFLAEYYELHRRDATAMERLTWSEFVVDIYGYCGQSAFNEMADFPYADVRDLEKLNRRLRRRTGPEIDKIKLQLAASVAQGVADIHAIDGPHRATMVHYDLNPRNIALFSKARPKINDFNIAEFLTFDPATNATCGFPNRMHQPWWRAPEEVDENRTVMLDEKVDVYALCNILFSIYTTHAPRGKMKDYRMEGVRQLVLAGIPPEMPPPYNHTKNTITDVFEEIFSLCYATDPSERGTSQEITDMLVSALYDRIGKSKRKKVSSEKKKAEPDASISKQKGTSSTGQVDNPSSPDAAESVEANVDPVGDNGDNTTNADDDDSADTTADAAERTR